MPKTYSDIRLLVNNVKFFVDGNFQFNMSAPANSVESVVQNVLNILDTKLGTQPLQRSFGLDQSWIGLPGNLGTLQAQVAMVLAISIWEPRFSATKIQFSLNTSDILQGVYSVFIEGVVNLDLMITQQLFSGPANAPVWVLDAPFDGTSIPTAQQETLTL
jgi:hypothetical protein